MLHKEHPVKPKISYLVYHLVWLCEHQEFIQKVVKLKIFDDNKLFYILSHLSMWASIKTPIQNPSESKDS